MVPLNCSFHHLSQQDWVKGTERRVECQKKGHVVLIWRCLRWPEIDTATGCNVSDGCKRQWCVGICRVRRARLTAPVSSGDFQLL